MLQGMEINFKGIDNGIVIEIGDGLLEDITMQIEEKINENRNFYKGANILGIDAPNLNIRERLEIAFLLKYKYKFNISDKVLDEIALIKNDDAEQENKKLNLEKKNKSEKEGSMTKIVNKTIRSGQFINYDGNVVIVGDVNPGAKIEAAGSIIVLGTFRGFGYAGNKGDKEAIVASYKLFPTQLKIADKIARSSDEESDEIFTGEPELARIIDNKLVIEPYLPNK